MIKALVNEREQVTIECDGSICTEAGHLISTKVWQAKEIVIKAGNKTRTLTLAEAEQAVGKEAWIRTEEHGCAKLDRVKIMEVTSVKKA